MDLINENCFPEMAEILAKANKSNKQLDIFPVSDSDTDFDSWTDSWTDNWVDIKTISFSCPGFSTARPVSPYCLLI